MNESRLDELKRATLGQLSYDALTKGNFSSLLEKAVNLITQTLEIEYAVVWEIVIMEENACFVKAAEGWHSALGKPARVENPQVGNGLFSSVPTIVEDLNYDSLLERAGIPSSYLQKTNFLSSIFIGRKTDNEHRIEFLSFLRNHQIESGFDVAIEVQEQPFGFLGAYTTRKREFDREEVDFVKAIANLLSIVIKRQHQERALCQKEQRYRKLADAIPLIVWTAQPNGMVDYFNQWWFEYTGKSFEQTKGRGWQSVIHPDDRLRALEDWQRVFQTGESCGFEYRLQQADGCYRWHVGRAVPMRNEEGQIIWWIGTATDIDTQKQFQQTEHFLAAASQELASSLDYQTLLQRVAALAVPEIADWCAVDIWAEDGVRERRATDGEGSLQRLAVAHVDPGKVEWAKELQKRYPHDMNAKHGVANVLRTGQSELYEEIPDALLVEAACDREHLEILRNIGFSSAMVVPMSVRGRTLGAITFVYSESGRRYSKSDLGLAEDLARRGALAIENARLYRESQQKEAALRESEERFRTMADSAPVLLWVSGIDGLYTFFNQVWLNFTGRSLEEETGRGWMQGIHPDDFQGYLDTYMSAFTTREDFQMEYRLRRADGEYRWILDRGMPRFMPNGSFAGYIGSCIDITDRKLMEEIFRSRATELARLTSVLTKTNTVLEKRNQELDQFAYIVSHDLKAPLRAIANLSQWIEEDLQEHLTGDTKHQMDLLRGRVHRMEALIQGILEYSRVGRVKTAKELVDVGVMLENAIASLAPPPTFTITVESEMPVFTTERLLLEQVFTNLISNAIKHHNRPDGTVTISCQNKGEFYEFVVRDDGPGIAPQYHEKVFVIFQTLLARDRVENTGIGLSLVKKIVEDKGGNICLESEVDRGATFRFTWPK
ncbi:MAG TPA: PAS domain S-box protein [Leptolyngbyaceae cyanobacterium]